MININKYQYKALQDATEALVALVAALKPIEVPEGKVQGSFSVGDVVKYDYCGGVTLTRIINTRECSEWPFRLEWRAGTEIAGSSELVHATQEESDMYMRNREEV